jgi:hypothetical protein
VAKRRESSICTQLMTEVIKLSYDVRGRCGYLTMGPGCCCDMAGAIALFERITSEVNRIETYALDIPDTRYVKQAGQWSAINLRQPGGLT